MSVHSQAADFHISSNGKVAIWVTGSFNAQISSFGNAKYYGRMAFT